MTPRSLVIGLGQPAAGDDGVGIAVIVRLRAEGELEGVSYETAAEASALVERLQTGIPVIVVDAIVGGGKPKPDLILLDIVMPNLNGLELAEKIRKMHRDIQIIILTGYPEYPTEDERGKFLDYMTKPVDVKKLYDTIVKALDISVETNNGVQARS